MYATKFNPQELRQALAAEELLRSQVVADAFAAIRPEWIDWRGAEQAARAACPDAADATLHQGVEDVRGIYESALFNRRAHWAHVQGRPATCHGFRSSFRDWCADHGYATELAERALAHRVANAVQAAYERSDRLEARRDLMARWNAYVMNGAESNVIPMRARSA